MHAKNLNHNNNINFNYIYKSVGVIWEIPRRQQLSVWVQHLKKGLLQVLYSKLSVIKSRVQVHTCQTCFVIQVTFK